MRGIRDYFNQVSYELMNVLIPLIPLAYLAHVLGNIGLGISALAIGTAELLILVFIRPTSIYGQWQLTNHRDNPIADASIFWNTLLIRMLLSLLAVLSLLGLLHFGTAVQVFKVYRSAMLISIIIIVGSLFDISWFFVGTGHHLRAILQASFTKIMVLLLILICVKTVGDSNAYILIYGVMRLVSNLILWAQLPKHIFTRIHLQPQPYLKGVLTMFSGILGIELFALIGRFLLPFFNSNAEIWIGYYDVALRLNQVAIVLTSTIGLSTMPRFYHIYRQNNYDKLIQHIDNAVESVTAFAVPLVFGTAATAVTFTTWFLGPNFREAGILMVFMAPLILLLGWNTILGGQFLRLAYRNQVLTGTMLAGLGINLFLNLLLIPQFGTFGAVFALLGSELFIFGLQLFFARDVIAFGRIVVLTSKYIINGLFMYLVIVVSTSHLPAYPSTTVLQLVIGVVVYIIGILLLRSVLLTRIWQIMLTYIKFLIHRH
ncbi:polysaccharide biosynthesis C-terminal domain-containing protein [Weissella diestrammenae]|uniref:Polysaccharide biosynthesis C-terminal domain-containing protein n=1 Tax=Weissella diestrammenae TaxID=1162633 RepID=A0A7G9T5D1_9LACO|nr:polysaccharide biosynthesis C-terminal domain-containing protein [Weissella diestrammenae]MCM0583165.1 polysaccharide biosynthesis C-terminal domain-containing protein [Weissella diestrammenae]QNN75306.1 polysaccharide biosynthesis C-terminal domain-containing protein [Weissella diestrammenae]